MIRKVFIQKIVLSDINARYIYAHFVVGTRRWHSKLYVYFCYLTGVHSEQLREITVCDSRAGAKGTGVSSVLHIYG